MHFSQRRIGMLVLNLFVAGVLSSTAAFAQESTETPQIALNAVGSRIGAPALEAAAQQDGIELPVEVTGTTSGFMQFCSGEADITTANRAIDATEEANCAAFGTAFYELLVGYYQLAFVSNNSATFAQCLTRAELNTLLQPSAEGQITDWSQVNAANPVAPITVYAPEDDSSAFGLLDDLIPGDGIRGDATRNNDTAALIAAAAGDVNGIAIIPYTTNLQSVDIRILEINSGAGGCSTPTAENAESGAYTASLPLYVYANATSTIDGDGRVLLDTLVSNEAIDLFTAFDITAASESLRATGVQTLIDGTTGRQFSVIETTYVIPPNVAGTLTIGGASNLNAYMTTVTDAFTAAYAGVTITTTIEGQEAGLRRLCAGETDIALAFRELPQDRLDACTAANITPVVFDVGSQVAVLVANETNDYLQCLTPANVLTAFRAASAGTVTTWNTVNAEFPEETMTLFVPPEGNVTAEILMYGAGAPSEPVRVDIQLESDAVIRAAAVGNVPGALALLSWEEYQAMLTAGQTRVQVVSINAEGDCIEPTEATIQDGTYALARPGYIMVNQIALQRPEVQSLLWFLAGDENYAQITSAGFVGLTFADMAALRSRLQTLYAEAAAAAALTPNPEATAESTPSAESTGEAVTTAEPTEEATVDDAQPTEAATTVAPAPDEAQASEEAMIVTTEVIQPTLDQPTPEATTADSEPTEEATAAN